MTAQASAPDGSIFMDVPIDGQHLRVAVSPEGRTYCQVSDIGWMECVLGGDAAEYVIRRFGTLHRTSPCFWPAAHGLEG